MATKNSKVGLTNEQAKKLVDNLLETAEDNRATREKTFRENFSFALDGDQWETDEIQNEKAPQLEFNQTEDYIEIQSAKLIPINQNKGIMEIGVKSYEKENKEKFEKAILDTYAENEMVMKISEQQQNFFYGGAACLYFPQDPLSKKTKIISINPTKVLLGWEGSKLTQFAFVDEISLMTARENKKNNWLRDMIKNVLGDNKEITQKFKKVKRITYWDTEHQIILFEDKYTKVTRNEKGEVPAVWIPNQPKPHLHEGRSDVQKLKNLDKEYNMRTSDMGQRVEENTKPWLATFSDSKIHLDRNDRGHLPLEKDDDAKFLTVPEAIENIKYTANIAERMQMKMGINDAVLGKIKSNISALAMAYYFSPLADKVAKKRIYWDKAFRDMNSAILKNNFIKGNFRTDPIYQPAMVIDEAEKVRNTLLLLNNRIISYVDAIDELRGSENAEEKIKEIKKEISELSEIDNFLQVKKQEPSKLEVN